MISPDERYPKRRAKLLGSELAYVEVGEGDPIVFLHGNPTSSYLWRNVIPHLVGLGRCIAPDLIGMGDSRKLEPSGPDRYRFVEHRRFLDALLDLLAVRENVTLVGGVAPTAIRFARYLRRKHSFYPKDLWQALLVTLGSIPGINTTSQPALRALYGPVAIREIYGTTEGIFGQQRDDKRAWVPNYDQFVFEVQNRSGVKMLHQMRPGEMGSLVVSTPTLPRYLIGDLILALQPPYFRCIGRDKWYTPFRYAWGELATLNFGRL